MLVCVCGRRRREDGITTWRVGPPSLFISPASVLGVCERPKLGQVTCTVIDPLSQLKNSIKEHPVSRGTGGDFNQRRERCIDPSGDQSRPRHRGVVAVRDPREVVCVSVCVHNGGVCVYIPVCVCVYIPVCVCVHTAMCVHVGVCVLIPVCV